MAYKLDGYVLIYGGRGELGSKCVTLFKNRNYWVGSVDFLDNKEANFNISFDTDDEIDVQEEILMKGLKKVLKGNKLDGIICVAGGSAFGNASRDLINSCDYIWKRCVWCSLLAARVASEFLKADGILVLAGAKRALKPTPDMIGYGMAKAAIHNLVKSLAHPSGGLPYGTTVTAILPGVLDSEENRRRKEPPFGTSHWTPVEYLAQLFLKWVRHSERPFNGSLCQITTSSLGTKIVPM